MRGELSRQTRTHSVGRYGWGSAVGAVLLVVALLVACAPAAAPQAAPAPKPAAEAPKPAAAPQPAEAPKPAAAPKPAEAAKPAQAPKPAPAAAAMPRTKSGYPNKTIDFIVAYGPGGGTDVTARLMTPYFQQRWGVSFNVINLPGASGQTGTLRALQARPDGYTMLVDTHGTASMMAAGAKELPFDWRKRTWIARVSFDPVFFQVKADSPWKNVNDVVAAAKANPQGFVWGAAGVSAIGHWTIGQLLTSVGIKPGDTNKVMFKSGAETVTAVAAGQIQLASQQKSEVMALVAAGRIRLVGTVADKRDPEFPDVATAAEQGYPKVNLVGWHGVSGPPGLPAEITEFWLTEIKKAAADPEFIRRFEQVGKVVAPILGGDFEKYNIEQYESLLPLAKALGVE